MQAGFGPSLDFTMLPDNDGQPYHVDSGGPTSWGVTRANWARWTGQPISVDSMRALTKEMVVPIYQAWWWHPISGDSLPAGVDLMVFDAGVNTGIHAAAVQLQQVLGFSGTDVDGDIGPETLGHANATDSRTLIAQLGHRQDFFYRGCHDFDLNGHGWLARLQRRTNAAYAMLAKGTT